MKKTMSLLNLFIGLALALNLGCQSEKKSQSDEVLLGAVFPLTGPIASYGEESVNGIRLALEKINAEKTLPKKIKLIVEDNKGEPGESANAVRKLIDIDKVSAILGSVASSNTLAAAPIAQRSRVPLLSPASTNEKVTQAGEYVARTCFTDDFQGVVLAKFAHQTLKKKKAAIIVDNASDYSKGLEKVFREKFTQLGGKVIDQQFTYTQKDTDFRSLLKKVAGQKPDVIFLPGYYTEVGLILKQARQMGINLPFLGGDGWDSPKLQELAGPQGVQGNYISSHFSSEDTDPKVQSFVKEYKAKYGNLPGAMAALGYDAMLVMADSLKRAKEMNSEEIKKAINSTQNFQGITGSITIDSNRNAQKSAVILETQPQKMAFKQKISP